MGRAPCCDKVGMKRGRWTAEEDRLLSDYIHAYGEGSWRSLPKKAGLKRCGKSCRLRWINYLREDVKRGNITSEEEELIVKLHSSYGNRWSLIATKLPGRTDNEIKNYWNSHLSRKLHYFMRKSTVKMTFISPPLPKPKSTQETKNGAVSVSIPAEKEEEEEALRTQGAYKTNFSINNGDSEAARGSIDQTNGNENDLFVDRNFDRGDSQNLLDGNEALEDLFFDRDVETRESQNLRDENEGLDGLVLSWLLEGEEDLLDLWP